MFGNCSKVNDGLSANFDVSDAVREGRHWYLYLEPDLDLLLATGAEPPRIHVCGLVKSCSQRKTVHTPTRRTDFFDDPPLNSIYL